jgi:hypothetical protein
MYWLLGANVGELSAWSYLLTGTAPTCLIIDSAALVGAWMTGYNAVS